MGFFRNLLGRRERNFTGTILNPLLAMKLEEFVIAGSLRVKHYFHFTNKEGNSEEFVVAYDYFDPELIYSHTLYRRTGEADFSSGKMAAANARESASASLHDPVSERSRPKLTISPLTISPFARHTP